MLNNLAQTGETTAFERSIQAAETKLTKEAQNRMRDISQMLTAYSAIMFERSYPGHQVTTLDRIIGITKGVRAQTLEDGAVPVPSIHRGNLASKLNKPASTVKHGTSRTSNLMTQCS